VVKTFGNSQWSMVKDGITSFISFFIGSQ
jgi:hypothetical protein